MRPDTQALRLALGALALGGVHLRRRRPFVLNQLVTVRCNLACPFCYVSGPEQKAYNKRHYPKRDEMTTGEMLRFYDALHQAGFRLAVIVGGEPLLRDDLPELVRSLAGRLHTTVFSNGLVLADRAGEVGDMDTLFVSLDAPDERHDELRRCPGLFAKAMAGIEAVRAKHPRLTVALNMTVTRANADRVDEMIVFANRLGLPVAFQPPSYEGCFEIQGRPNDAATEEAPETEVIVEAFRKIRAASAKGERIIGTRAFFDLVVNDQRRYPCQYPTYALGPVMPNGDVIGCTTSQVIGNVRETSIEALLKGPGFRATAEDGPVCPRGCRDWGIHDLSAVHNHQFGLADVRTYRRAFGGRA